jgi:DNA-binding GntR family transcriptional regulator
LQEILRWVLAEELRDVDSHRAIADAVSSADEDGASDGALRLLALGTASMQRVLASIAEDREEKP